MHHKPAVSIWSVQHAEPVYYTDTRKSHSKRFVCSFLHITTLFCSKHMEEDTFPDYKFACHVVALLWLYVVYQILQLTYANYRKNIIFPFGSCSSKWSFNY